MDDGGDHSVKLAIHVAETGHYFELSCPSSASVHHVKSCISSTVRVSPQDQLLLCDHTRLEPDRALASYKLQPQHQNVFLFNRARLLANAPLPPPEELPIKELALPPSPPSVSVRTDLLEVVDKPTEVLRSYEAMFHHHVQKGRAFLAASGSKYELCRQLFREQKVQSLALEAAKSNVNHFYKIIEQNHTDFMKRFNVQGKEHGDILTNFDTYLERLRECKLHPHLMSKDRTALLDCLNESSMREKLRICTHSQKQFEGKVLALKASHAELDHSVQELFKIVPGVDFQRLEQVIVKKACILEEQQVILESLGKDTETVTKLVHDFEHLPNTNDAAAALGPMRDVHEKNHLPKMEACHQSLGILLDHLKAKKHGMCMCVHTCMQKVAALQCSIRDMRSKLSAFTEAMSHQDELFSDLKLVLRVGPAYRACLAEVTRRKASMKLYMGEAGQLAEAMAKKRAVEAARREEFLRVQSTYLPRDLLFAMGLFGMPSQCVVNIEPYDTDLLDLDIKDLEKYAPEGVFTRHANPGSTHLPPDDCALKACTISNSCSGVEDDADDICGTSKLEVENAWLKAECASAVAQLCSINLDLHPCPSQGGAGPLQSHEGAAKKTSEALALKDEHAKHLESLLHASRERCKTYEQRIQELEQLLSDQHRRMHEITASGLEASGVTYEDTLIDRMDEGGGDETMTDVLGRSPVRMGSCEGSRSCGHMEFAESSSRKEEAYIALEAQGAEEKQLAGPPKVVLQIGGQCSAIHVSLDTALGESAYFREELQKKTAILNECYMNSAELESELLLARQQAHTFQCLATRKATEYNTLRASTVKLRGLVERLHHCVSTSQMDLAESLRALADSLNSYGREDVTREFGACVNLLADRVGKLLLQKQDMVALAVSANKSTSVLDRRKTRVDLLKEQYERHKISKQV